MGKKRASRPSTPKPKTRRKKNETASGLPKGVLTFDVEESAVFVYADVDEVTSALAALRGAQSIERNILGRTVQLADDAAFVFRFHEEPWTQILCFQPWRTRKRTDGELEMVWDLKDVAKRLSESLNTRAIEYGNSDCAGATGYTLFDSGAQSELFYSDEGGRSFESKERELSDLVNDPEHYWSTHLVDEFFYQMDVCVAGLSFSRFVGAAGVQPGVSIEFHPDSFPEFERIDYVSGLTKGFCSVPRPRGINPFTGEPY